MSEILIIFASIAFLFALFLALQAQSSLRFCALCAAVSLTWFGLIILYWLGMFKTAILIAPLLGASVTGIYYLAEKKTKEELHLFRLPFFLTLLLVAYALLGVGSNDSGLFLLLAILWFSFGAVFLYRKNPKFAKLARRIIECCKNW